MATGKNAHCLVGLSFTFALGLVAACHGDDGVDLAPVAEEDLVTVDEDAPIAVDVLANDSDPQGRPLVIRRAWSDGQEVTVEGGLVHVAPQPDWNGTIEINYVLVAGEQSARGRAVVTVTPVNDAPIARAGSIVTGRNAPKAVQLAATDVDGDTLAFEIETGPAHGTLSGTAPALTYTPDAGYVGDDTIVFHARDAAVSSAAATIAVSVVAGSTPVAQAQSVATPEDTAKTITLAATDADNDPLTFAITQQPAHGTLTGTPPAVTYTPAAEYNGADSFAFTATDGLLTSAAATVTVNVSAMNDAPVAEARAVAAVEDMPSLITLVGTDIDGDSLTRTIVDAPAHGTLTGNGATRTYQSAPNYNGVDSFTFTVSDGTATSAPATVSITIAPAEDSPIAIAQVISINEDTEVPIVLTGTDADGEALSFIVTSIAPHGYLEGVPPSLTYRPYADFHGTDTFTFRASDAGGFVSQPATITINIASVDDAPFIPANLTFTGDEDAQIPITLPTTDRDGEAVMYAVATQPAHGVISGTGAALQYLAHDYDGPDSFALTATDGHTTTQPRTISVNVQPTPDDPIARDDVGVATAGQPLVLDVLANDVEVDGEFLTITSVSTPTHGTAITDGEQVQFTGAPGNTTQATFTYTIVDSSGADATATVTIGFGQLPTGLSLAYAGHGVDVPDLNQSIVQHDISADGRYISFTTSRAIAADDTNQTNDIYVWDRVSGAYERVSVPTAGGVANDFSVRSSISDDGRYVAFQSYATNLVAGDTNGKADIFVRDRVAGTTVRASVSSTGAQSIGASAAPKISGDGSAVAFGSSAFDLVPSDANGAYDIFVRDLTAGTTTRVSVPTGGGEADWSSSTFVLSGDGRVVAFVSSATNLVTGDTNNVADIFVHDRTTGITERVSVSSTGGQANGASSAPTLSNDGRFVGFRSGATNLIPSSGTLGVVVVRDRQGMTTISAVGSNTLGITLSGDGRYITGYYENGTCFLRDRFTSTYHTFAAPGPGPGTSGTHAYHPIISRNGKYVAVMSNDALLPDVSAGTKVFVFPNPL